MKKNCHRPWYVKIIYIDIEIEGYGMNATENDKSRI